MLKTARSYLHWSGQNTGIWLPDGQNRFGWCAVKIQTWKHAASPRPLIGVGPPALIPKLMALTPYKFSGSACRSLSSIASAATYSLPHVPSNDSWPWRGMTPAATGWVSLWMSRSLRPTRHIIAHFADESWCSWLMTDNIIHCYTGGAPLFGATP